MKQFLVFFLAAVANLSAIFLHAETPSNSRIEWFTNYESAVQEAKKSSKPIFLFFTGSGWCGWCTKLEGEVLNTQEFKQLAGSKYVFVKLDFPGKGPASPQNKELQKKYGVKSFPTVILLDPQDLEQIGTTGYRAGGASQYAAHLEKLLSNYSGYKTKIKEMPNKTLSAKELRKLYEKSKELDLTDDANYIVTVGIESEAKIFFLTERYRLLAEEGLIHHPEAVALKHQLLSLDPNNSHHTHYHVAVIEFEAFSEEMHRENYSSDLAVSPLVAYIQTFGKQDKENLWRLEMIISQVYLDKNRLKDALKHAQASHDAAPPAVQDEIAFAIKSIKLQLD